MCIHVKERHSNYHCVDQFCKVKYRSKVKYINILNELKALLQKCIANKAIGATTILFWNPHWRHFFIAFRERGREKEKHQCKREASTSFLPYMPRPGIIGTWVGDWTCSPSMYPTWKSNLQPFGYRWHSSQLSHTGQGRRNMILKIILDFLKGTFPRRNTEKWIRSVTQT